MTTRYRSSGSSGGVPTAALELPVTSATGGSAWCNSAKTLRGLRCLGAIVGLIVDDFGTRRRAILRPLRYRKDSSGNRKTCRNTNNLGRFGLFASAKRRPTR
jgi:hypothetical protein